MIDERRSRSTLWIAIAALAAWAITAMAVNLLQADAIRALQWRVSELEQKK